MPQDSLFRDIERCHQVLNQVPNCCPLSIRKSSIFERSDDFDTNGMTIEVTIYLARQRILPRRLSSVPQDISWVTHFVEVS